MLRLKKTTKVNGNDKEKTNDMNESCNNALDWILDRSIYGMDTKFKKENIGNDHFKTSKNI